MWDPGVYSRYGDERSRPFFDLVAQIGAEKPRAVVDLGCGPGTLTATLAERWPSASITGIDSSPEMIARARQAGLPVRFVAGDVRFFAPEPDVDVLVTNATLQWVPGHQDLLRRWARQLAPGGWIA
ncbi:methyltransferase domain-containing protein, partial [Actinoplanes sp. NPDC051633]|uniref:methyltransferase domain-containing protein n=1 Tax=Actinoplanes sp. NPDC051633 TaxID=3155670 RepID=UPI00342FB8C4